MRQVDLNSSYIADQSKNGIYIYVFIILSLINVVVVSVVCQTIGAVVWRQMCARTFHEVQKGSIHGLMFFKHAYGEFECRCCMV